MCHMRRHNTVRYSALQRATQYGTVKYNTAYCHPNGGTYCGRSIKHHGQNDGAWNERFAAPNVAVVAASYQSQAMTCRTSICTAFLQKPPLYILSAVRRIMPSVYVLCDLLVPSTAVFSELSHTTRYHLKTSFLKKPNPEKQWRHG